ncbi:hypothetical protein EYZ11_013011 [Aspergillus tanneri]|uniref:Major facilitator superfamily (MFS) profile domain-containing protein n=1 Tax=Aspergillus tanneri TaxID=1220188 RepID=A0A4V6RQM0_9EURO|nr:uncharacterized protein ATNIH1004_009740 [Aspergillus tanneri]KAA8642978.1 hypothetical protein ATNIH1004_009740 [Aspergillus tanneri]THC87544.1 hypothetical protein EYZ11_013011 [Aspergillus tanneri]
MARRYLGLQGSKLQISIGLIAGMGFLLFGYNQGVTGRLLTLNPFIKYFPTIALNGIGAATYNLGCFAGSIPTIWVGSWLGLRKTIFLGSFIMVVGTLLQCTAFHLPQLIVEPLVTGFGEYSEAWANDILS